jgi:hypothetical protein
VPLHPPHPCQLSRHLGAVGPELVCDLLDKVELGEHLVLGHGLGTNTSAGETALGADTNALHGLLTADALTLGNDVGGLEDLLLHLFGILKVGDLGADDTENDILVLGEEAEGLEATAAGVIVLEVEGVVVEGLEESLGDLLVRALGEVHRLGEVTCAGLVY